MTQNRNRMWREESVQSFTLSPDWTYFKEAPVHDACPLMQSTKLLDNYANRKNQPSALRKNVSSLFLSICQFQTNRYPEWKTPELALMVSRKKNAVCRRDISLNCNRFYFYVNHHRKKNTRQRKYRKCAFHFHDDKLRDLACLIFCWKIKECYAWRTSEAFRTWS